MIKDTKEKVILLLYADKGLVCSIKGAVFLRYFCHIIGSSGSILKDNKTFISHIPLEINMDEVSLVKRKGWVKTIRFRHQTEDQRLINDHILKSINSTESRSLISNSLETDRYTISHRQLELLKSDVTGVHPEHISSTHINRKASVSDILLNLRKSFNSIPHSMKNILCYTDCTIPRTSIQWSTVAAMEDLHSLGYGVRNGIKFGGEYLIYPGDPEIYHAQSTIRIMGLDHLIKPSMLVSHQRSSQGTRKHLNLILVRRNKYSKVRWRKHKNPKKKKLRNLYNSTHEYVKAIEKSTLDRRCRYIGKCSVAMTYLTFSPDGGIKINRV